MDPQSSSQKTTEQAVGQTQEDQEALLDILTPQPEFKKPVQVSTPRDKGALTGEVKHFPAPKPGGDEYTVRTHEEELPAASEEKFSVQVSDEGADQDLPRWVTDVPPIKSYTNSKDLDMYERSYKLEVMEDCRAKFKDFPSALGLIVLFACTSAAPSRNLPPVPGVKEGVTKMIDTFRFLGYAILRLPVNLASWQYRAAMKAVASVSFPKSYHRIVVYFTGHGGDDSIDTPDGNLELVDITTPFSPNKALHLELLTKIFIFDTCSSLNKLHSIFRNTVLLFPAHSGYPAFAQTGGCGLLTQYLARILRTSPNSFGDIVIDVSKEIENDHRWSDYVPLESRPLLLQTLTSHVFLFKERKEAMTPSIKIQEISPTSLSVVISLSPSSAQFHLQHLRLLYKREGAEQWTHVEVNAALGGTVMINNLSHGKLYSVKAVAVYPDDEEISSPEMECNMPTGVEPVLHRNVDYCHVDSVEFEVCQPAKKDDYQMRWFEVVCRSEDTPEPKPIEWPENDRVRISELEPGVQYTVTATVCYPNDQSVSATESFEIPICDVTPQIDLSESQPPTHDSVTVSVTAPPQAEKYHLDNLELSVKLWRKTKEELWQENKGELQSQTVQVNQRGKSVTFRKLSSSTTYVAKAIATDPHKVVSSDTRQIATLGAPYCKMFRKIFFPLFMALLILGFSVSLTFFILFQQVHIPAVTKFGVQGDTIVVSDFNSFGLTSVTITECPEEGDDPHTLKTALVKISDVIKYSVNYTNATNGSATSRVNLLEDEYFLQESRMAFNICLSSPYSPLESSRSVSVFAFVFDSSDDNQKFLMNETDGIHSSRYHKALQVGSTSQPICTWVNYSIASPAYYYLSLGEYSLGTLEYSADLHLHEIFLNFSDYEGSEQYCSSVPEMQPCIFKLHDRLKKQVYILVTYICIRPSEFSPSTHVCTNYTKPSVIVDIVRASLGIAFVLLLAAFVVLVAVLFYKKSVNCIDYKRCRYTPVHDSVPLL